MCVDLCWYWWGGYGGGVVGLVFGVGGVCDCE